MTAAGMTDTPKVRFNNSVLNVPAQEAEAKADKAADAKVKADPNAGAAADEAKAPGAKAKAPVPDAKEPAAAVAVEAKAAATAAAAVDPATGLPVPPAAGALVQKQDTIGEPKYDYSVYDFAHNAIYDPLEARRQTDGPYANNGYAAGKWSALAQRNKNDISDKNIDEEVFGFVRADKNTVPHQLGRRDSAYPVNGWANTPPSTNGLAQRATKDIGDTNIDEEVVGFVRADKNMMPIPQFARRDTAYPVNGWSNTPPSQALSQKRDIAQGGVEANVYDFTHDKVEAPNWERRTEKFNNNGYAAAVPHWGTSLAQSQDIGIKEVRPDVYVTVNRMIDPAAHFRSDKAPKDSYEPYQGVQEPYPKGEPKPKEKNPDGLDFVQTDAEFLGSPERVNVLDPIAYQTRANGNTIDGGIQIRRTTFYNKKAGLWQGENSMM